MQEIIPVDVNAVFNTLGEIQPRYVRLEFDHELITYKIEQIITIDKTRIAGFHCVLFRCKINRSGGLTEIRLRYTSESNIWHIIE